MGVKISELPVTSSATSNDKMVVNHENVTNQITVEDLMQSYLSGAGYMTESELLSFLTSSGVWT